MITPKGVKVVMVRVIVSLLLLIFSAGFDYQQRSSPDAGSFLPFSINFIKPDGTAIHDFDVSDYKPQGRTYYVNINIGSDTNDGLTVNTAFKSVNKALTKTDIDVMRLSPGTYGWDYSGAAITVSRSLAIIAEGGRAQLTTHDKLNWTKTSNANYTYQAVRTSSASVYDSRIKDEYGDYQRLKQRNSILEVDQNPGSWYTDGTNVYVQAVDSRVVDSDIRVYLASNGFRYTGEGKLYIENIDFEGGYSALRIEGNNPAKIATIYAKNSTFKYATVRNGLTILGADAYIQDCTASSNYLDGFNYHAYNGIIPKVIETESVGKNNGWENGHSNNGSTMHDGGTIVRVNGKYFANDGPNIADVNGAKSWNVSIESFNSTAAGTQGANFYGDGVMWLDTTITYGSPFDLVAYSGEIHTRDLFTRGENKIISGKISDY